MNLTIKAIARIAAVAAMSSGYLTSTAAAEEKKKVTYSMISTIIDATVIPYGVLAKQKGWFEEEGLDVNMQTVATGGQSLQLLLAGQVQIAFLSPDAMIQATLKEPTNTKMFHPLVRRQVFGAIVPDGSPIQSYCDLEGKTVGFPSFSVAMQAYVDVRMQECGKSVESVKRVESGFGVSSAQALDSKSIDAFVGYPTLFVGYSNAGYKFRRLAPADWQLGFYGTGFAATTAYMAENPDVIEKFSRVMAKSAVYIKANPEDSVRALWAENPAAAPKSDADVAEYMKRDLAVLTETMNMMRVDEFPPEFKWGSQDAATWQRHIDKQKETKQLPQDFAGKPEDYFTNEFNDAANDFDRQAVIAEAQKAK